jgi:hypothetical protein
MKISIKKINRKKLEKSFKKSYKKNLKTAKLNIAKLKSVKFEQIKHEKKAWMAAVAVVLVVGTGAAVGLSGGKGVNAVVSGAHASAQGQSNGKAGSNNSSNSSSTSNTSSSSTHTGYVKTKNGVVKITAKTVVTPANPVPNTNKPAPGGKVGPNLISNPSVETASAGAPAGWSIAGWGTNTPAYSYLDSGHSGGHSLQASISGWTNGDAKWGFTPINVASGSSYQFSDFYQSTVATEVDAAFTVNGVASFINLGTVPASGGWSQFVTQFTAPAGAANLVVYHILPGNGSLTTDDYFLGTYTPATFNRGIVTVNLDDGWLNQYQNAAPVLESQGLPASFFIITGSSITTPDPLYMNVSQVVDLKNHGFEIGNHTKTHPDLTTLSAAQQQDEMVASQSVFQSAIGVAPTDFAYPFGAYNSATLSLGAGVFQTQRTVVSGFNTKDTINFQQLKIEEVDSNISTAQVQAWINAAIAQKTWLILVYHEIATTPADPTDALYTIPPTDFAAQMAYLKASGAAVETTQQAYNEVRSQL